MILTSIMTMTRTAPGASFMPTDTIYTASDLKDRRTEILETASHGRAVVRAVDGTALVMTTLGALELSEKVAHWALLLHAVRRGEIPAELSWLRHLDSEDRSEFVEEAVTTLVDCAAGVPLSAFDDVVGAWRVTALALADDTRRGVLLGGVSEADFDDVDRPGGSV